MSVWQYMAEFFDDLISGLNGIRFFGVSIMAYLFACLVAIVFVNFLIKVAHK